jgi:transposase
MGLLRASFVPPKAIQDLRDYTRARIRLVHERTRCWQRLEKLLESALVKVSSVASKLTTVSAQDMIQAMIAGERDPGKLADLARTRMRAKHDDLVQALDGMFDDHHGELAALLLDQIAFLGARIAQLGARAAELTAAMPEAWGINPDGTTGPDAGAAPGAPALNAVARLAEIPGISEDLARAIIAESGSPGRFPGQGPLRTVRARCPGTRLKQAPGALRAGVLASCVGGRGARDRRRRVSGGFGSLPACHARPGGRGIRRRSPCGPGSATSVPTPGGTGAGRR